MKKIKVSKEQLIEVLTQELKAVKILSELEKQLPDKTFMFTLKENK